MMPQYSGSMDAGWPTIQMRREYIPDFEEAGKIGVRQMPDYAFSRAPGVQPKVRLKAAI
jgi:hypothetical protein